MPLVVTLQTEPSTALELVRRHFEGTWAARVHALQWLSPRALLFPLDDLDPFLVLHVDSLGKLQAESCKADGIPVTSGLTPLFFKASQVSSGQPWSDPDWLGKMNKWIAESLDVHSVQCVSQVRVAPSGAVLKIYGGRGTYFLKTLPPFLAYEVPLVSLLCARLPLSIPHILPLRPDARSYVACAVEGQPLSTVNDKDRWTQVLKEVAKIQIKTSAFISEIESCGVPCETFATFKAKLKEQLSAIVSMQKGLSNALSDSEMRRIASLTDLAEEDCHDLEQCGLPQALVHGEPSEANTFVTPTGINLIDWAFSRVSHPFFTLHTFRLATSNTRHRMHSDWEALTSAYLEPWLEFAAPTQLKRALAASLRLMWIEAAEHTAKFIRLLQNDEPGNIRSIPVLLRRVLSAYEA